MLKNTRFHVLLLVCLLGLSACESTVRTQIQTFRNDAAGAALSGKVYIAPAGGEKDNSLEFDFYRKKLAQRLAAIGLTETDKASADYIATLGYGVSRQEKDRPNTRVYVSGYWGHYPRSGLIMGENLGSEYEFVRELSFKIDRNDGSSEQKPAEKIVQILATSEGACQHLSVVYDEMLEAIFANLWRANGSLVTLTVKGDAKCP